MKHTKYFLIILILNISLNMVACNKNKITDPNQIKDQLLTKMSEQKNYSFNGSTSASYGGMTMEDMIKFEGYINEKENVYLNMNIAGLQEIGDEKMEIVKTPSKYKIKYAEGDWQEVSQDEMGLFTEFQNWNPESMLNLMKNNAVETTLSESKNDTNMNTIVIKLDPTVMKNQAEQQMRKTMENGGLTEEDIQNMKDNLGYSDEEIAQMQDELQKQLEQSNKVMEEMIRTMSVDSTFEIHYEPTNMLIQEITQNTINNYETEGQKVQESTSITMKFKDFGKKKELPTT